MDIIKYSAIHSLELVNFDLRQPLYREEQQILLQIELLLQLNTMFNMLISAKHVLFINFYNKNLKKF